MIGAARTEAMLRMMRRIGQAGGGRFRLLLLLVLSLALGMQSVLLQSHRHEPAPACSTAHVDCAAQNAPAKSGGAAHKAGHCALCEAARIAGHYLPVAVLALVLALFTAAMPMVASRRTGIIITHRRPWQSRAPPVLLPACLSDPAHHAQHGLRSRRADHPAGTVFTML